MIKNKYQIDVVIDLTQEEKLKEKQLHCRKLKCKLMTSCKKSDSIIVQKNAFNELCRNPTSLMCKMANSPPGI